jgi:hypothetical protein
MAWRRVNGCGVANALLSRKALVAWRALGLSLLLEISVLQRARAQNRADYRYADYAEQNNRIHVQTQDAYFDTRLSPLASLKGDFVSDAVSGATPTGAPWLPGTNAVNTAQMNDHRYAGFIEPTFYVNNWTVSPMVSYSQEHDYRSLGIAVNTTRSFNEKNTTVALGLAHSFDQVLPNEGELYYVTDGPITSPLDKADSSMLLGVAQLLGPATVITINATLGYENGYLSDPYKRVLFDGVPYNPGPDPANPLPYTVWPEHRPGYKFRQVGFFSLNHNFEGVRGAMEATYRIYHDDFGVLGQTAGMLWNQHVGKYVMISPLFRFYTQTAAYFYATHFPGDPSNPAYPIPIPDYYSADYRLSELVSYTYGVSLTAQVQEHLSLTFSYMRYATYGKDGVTSPNQYPTANVFAGGLTVWF